MSQYYLTTRASRVTDAAIAPTALDLPNLPPYSPHFASRRFGSGRTICILLTIASRTLETRATVLLALKIYKKQEETQRRLAGGLLFEWQEAKRDSVIAANDKDFRHIVSLLKDPKSSLSQQGQSLRKKAQYQIEKTMKNKKPTILTVIENNAS